MSRLTHPGGQNLTVIDPRGPESGERVGRKFGGKPEQKTFSFDRPGGLGLHMHFYLKS